LRKTSRKISEMAALKMNAIIWPRKPDSGWLSQAMAYWLPTGMLFIA